MCTTDATKTGERLPGRSISSRTWQALLLLNLSEPLDPQPPLIAGCTMPPPSTAAGAT